VAISLHGDMETLIARLRVAMADAGPARGLGHDFYPYPARMSPAVARLLIQELSRPGDTVLDPFMGGGTTIVEALAHGRKAVGLDINAIAHLLTVARTTPLSTADHWVLRAWASGDLQSSASAPEGTKWEAIPHGPHFAALARAADAIPFPRRRRAAKAALLRLGQWALDRRECPPSIADLRSKLLGVVEHLIQAVSEVADHASSYGVSRKRLTGHRLLLNRSAVGAEQDPRLAHLRGSVDLVVSSPPYPGVHVLYHRWQLQSRRETPAPYWIIGSQDGHGASYYTMGSRTPRGIGNYFRTIEHTFESVRPLLRRNARVCLLMAFRDPVLHLPLFLQALTRAGFQLGDHPLLWRRVPNRKWYAARQSGQNAAREVLIILRPSEVALPTAPHVTA